MTKGCCVILNAVKNLCVIRVILQRFFSRTLLQNDKYCVQNDDVKDAPNKTGAGKSPRATMIANTGPRFSSLDWSSS